MNWIRHFLTDQRGAAMVMVAVAMIMIFGFAVLSIDVGTMAVVKTQLQDAADAAALAAAQSYVQSGGNDTLAIARAIEFAGKNRAIINAGADGFNKVDSVIIGPSDITFPMAGGVRVETHRTIEKGDPFRTYFMRVINPAMGNGQMTAHATAGFFWVCGTDCLRPWAPPDRWYDADSSKTYNPGPTNLAEYYDPITTGYGAADLGVQITLYFAESGESKAFETGWFYPVDYPPVNKGNPISGGDRYREWIAGCADTGRTVVEPGDTLRLEKGKMVGPTKQGLADLIALDDAATWDAATGEVINSAFDISPRIIKACLFDPRIGVLPGGGGKEVVVVKIMVLFIEKPNGKGDLTGRFMRLNSANGVNCADQSNPSFLYRTALTE